MMSEITRWSATDTAEKIRSRDVSVVEVAQAHIDRMESINPSINAITEPVREALDVARALDDAGLPEAPGPLYGVPVTTKINVDQAGYANSNGVPAFKGNSGPDDAPVVSNLKNGGAVIIGRTNTPEFSMRWSTSNPLHGVSLNPWDASVTPGGSSGAAAAAVAAGIGAIAHGNDLGGSLRYPAFCCGVTTIRPSFGRVPAGSPNQAVERPALTQTMSVQGPIARSVADVRAGLQVMSMRSSYDPLQVMAPNSGRKREADVTVGYAFNPYNSPLDPAVEAAMQTAIEGFHSAGVTTREINPPLAEDTADLWGRLLMTEARHTLHPAIKEHGSAEMNRMLGYYFDRFPGLDVTEMFTAMGNRIKAQRAWSQMFDDVDVFMMPTSLLRPIENDLDFKSPERIPDILEAQKPLHTINLLGLPSVALPTHLDEGVPMGVQLVGPMHDDWFVLDVAELLERELGTLWQKLSVWERA
ncbi:amidase [Phaeobacter italicus]|uniref:amidase n=1 Tax=Phaeobacter italicus TaxID=481446 RepID=UPI002430C48D|nr:amidase [Phaeobacter italicus]MCI5102123.1 amidase [Phaeobacter italicus]